MRQSIHIKGMFLSAALGLFVPGISGLGFGQSLFSQPAQIVFGKRASPASPLLFSYVSTNPGFDTEITITNTSQDTLGTTPQTGTCVVSLYGNQNGSLTLTQSTTPIPPGAQLMFSLLHGGGGISAVPNFSGYMIANCSFGLAAGMADVIAVSSGNHVVTQAAQALPPPTWPVPQYLLMPLIDSVPFASTTVAMSQVDTAITIANVSKNPFGTTPAAGSCKLYTYGLYVGTLGSNFFPYANPGCDAIANPLPGINCFPVVPGGQVESVQAFNLLDSSFGYSIASCNFQGAAGAVTIQDLVSGATATQTPELLTPFRDQTTYPLLFSSVTNQTGFDTVIAIANTNYDPFGTTHVSGSCTLNFYGTNPPAGPYSTGVIAAGTVFNSTVSAMAPGFQGYMAATCTFANARGWATWLENGHMDGGSTAAELVTLPRRSTSESLLFPIVSNWPNVDTEISIANTSADPFGTSSGSGTCTLSYFGQTGSGGSSPASQVTPSVQAGATLSFSLSQGNAAQGIAATPNFHGYVIASCGFPLARGMAQVTTLGPAPLTPALNLAESHAGTFVQGQTNATYSVVVSNQGTGPTSAPVSVTETVPYGLSYVSMSGDQWACDDTPQTCKRSDTLAAGASYPAIIVTVNVAPNPPSQVINQVTVSGGGSAGAAASDPTVIQQASLGAVSVVEGPGAGSDTVLLAVSPPSTTWTAQSNASWLHLSAGSASGAGNAGLAFSYDANSGAASRSGTLAAAGQTLTVTQAGSGFVPATAVSTVISSGLSQPNGVALDGQGNVYIADTGNYTIEEWSPASKQVTTLVAGSLSYEPFALAVDGPGNIYFNSANSVTKEWNAATGQITSLYVDLSQPNGVAVDGQGNVYVADFGGTSAVEWNIAQLQTTNLVSAGLSTPTGLAVDWLGNVYIADSGNKAVKEWSGANQQVTPLVSSGLSYPYGVAVDGQGNVYFSDGTNRTVQEWKASNQHVTTLASSHIVSRPAGLAVDRQGNVYIADSSAIKVVNQGYVSLGSTSLSETWTAGTDSIPLQVIPTTLPVAASSNQTWLAITGAGNGTIAFSFTANTGAARTAQITVLGQQITITQAGQTPCDANNDGNTDVLDVRSMIDEALGAAAPNQDLDHNGVVNVVDVQLVTNAALKLSCIIN